MIYFKNVDFKTRDFSPLMKLDLAGVGLNKEFRFIRNMIFVKKNCCLKVTKPSHFLLYTKRSKYLPNLLIAALSFCLMS